MEAPLLSVENLTISFGETHAVKDLTFTLQQGQTLGIVGESGSGKSITSMAIMGLLPKTAKIHKDSRIGWKTPTENLDLIQADEEQHQRLRGNQIGMIFQEPMTALNPSMRCGQQVEEVLLLHHKSNPKNAKNKVLELFQKVLLPNPERMYRAYPHELSGGQKQRVMIAMAISCEPKLLIADEPTTALDVTVQQTILELIAKLQADEGMSVLFISHDLGVIAQVCDEVLVMYRGEAIEKGAVQQIFKQPKENYTKGLIACRPVLEKRLHVLPTVADFTTGSDFEAKEFTPAERQAHHKSLYGHAPLLEIKNLKKYFPVSTPFWAKKNPPVKAVDDISFSVYPGETLGLVGESGSGKTTLSRTLLMLEKPTAGEIFFKGTDIAKLSKSELRVLRREIQIIFQDPYSSLNPRQTVGQILVTPMKVHGILSTMAQRKARAEELLVKVGLTSAAMRKYPHEFSGGQRQRLGIARALALEPSFIICDESVSALDVSVQAQVLNLLNDLKKEFGFTYIFISHDLAVVKFMADQLLVMQQGNLMEIGDADEIYANPKTPYTQELIRAIPSL